MGYLFSIFESVIGGDLSPFVVLNNRDHFLPLLQEEFTEFYVVHYATFKGQRNHWVYTGGRCVNGMNPFLKEFSESQQMELFANAEPNKYHDVYKATGIDPARVLHTAYCKQGGKHVFRIKESYKPSDVADNELKYYYYSVILKREARLIVDEIRKACYSFNKPEETSHYIHRLQQDIMNACYRLLKLISPKTQAELYYAPELFSDIEILRYAYMCLEELQRFLEKSYFAYLDKSVSIPYRSSLMKIHEIDDKLAAVKPALMGSQLNEDLLKLICAPLLKLTPDRIRDRISYKELLYLNVYLSAFYNEIARDGEAFKEAQVKRILQEVNYNCPELVRYEIDCMKAECHTQPGFTGKMDYLHQCLKATKQQAVKLSVSYYPQMIPLKEQLCCWLEEEISYLTYKARIDAKQDQQLNMFREEERLKLQSTLNLSQLAFFFKLQTEAGMISSKVQRDVFKHVAENYKTLKAPSISPDSVGTKFYNIDLTTVEMVKGYVIEMLNCIQEHASMLE